MNKNDVKDLFKELELEKAHDTKGMFSFRIDKATLEQFKKSCEVKGYAAGLVIEKLIQKYLQAE